MSNNQYEKRAHIAGWGIFIVCALFFLASSIVNKDVFALIGSLMFLLACFVFLYPLLCRSHEIGKSEKQTDNTQ